jgi:nitroreductase
VLAAPRNSLNRDALRRAADAARLAPSVHNTQPWRFRLTPGGLDLVLDLRRTLCVIDPEGREALLSCGTALLNARAALAAEGCRVHVQRFPRGLSNPLFARLVIGDGAVEPSESDLAQLAPAIRIRSTNRRPFDARHPSAEAIARWSAAAGQEDSLLVEVCEAEQRQAIDALTRKAEALETADPAYRAELRAWPGARPTDPGEEPDPTLLVLGSRVDDRLAWLRAGEALERVLLDLTTYGWSASPISQPLELPPTRLALARELGLTFHPHLVIRVGHAVTQPPVTPRRPLNEVLTGAD